MTSITGMSNNKKTPVKKSTTKKEVAKKTVAKKTPAKKAVAKKVVSVKKVAEAKKENAHTSIIDDAIDRTGLSLLVAEVNEIINAQKVEEIVLGATTVATEAINKSQKKIKFWRRILGLKAK